MKSFERWGEDRQGGHRRVLEPPTAPQIRTTKAGGHTIPHSSHTLHPWLTARPWSTPTSASGLLDSNICKRRPPLSSASYSLLEFGSSSLSGGPGARLCDLRQGVGRLSHSFLGKVYLWWHQGPQALQETHKGTEDIGAFLKFGHLPTLSKSIGSGGPQFHC